ncbi:hypothetical protein M8818_004126 [Zalaria obscura]|uniref:Uncharacterized protein n=1 Tax=Zalaria obscura TaxID=2024903 RepID=A0ACC3SFG4_9PEZI
MELRERPGLTANAAAVVGGYDDQMARSAGAADVLGLPHWGGRVQGNGIYRKGKQNGGGTALWRASSFTMPGHVCLQGTVGQPSGHPSEHPSRAAIYRRSAESWRDLLPTLPISQSLK